MAEKKKTTLALWEGRGQTQTQHFSPFCNSGSKIHHRCWQGGLKKKKKGKFYTKLSGQRDAQVRGAFLTDLRWFSGHNYKPDPVLLTRSSEGRQERWGKVGGKAKQLKKKKKKSVFFELLLPSKSGICLASAAAHNAGRECSISHSLRQRPGLLLPPPTPCISGAGGERLQLRNSHPKAQSCILLTPKDSCKNNGSFGCAGNAEVSWHLLTADGLH